MIFEVIQIGCDSYVRLEIELECCGGRYRAMTIVDPAKCRRQPARAGH